MGNSFLLMSQNATFLSLVVFLMTFELCPFCSWIFHVFASSMIPLSLFKDLRYCLRKDTFKRSTGPALGS